MKPRLLTLLVLLLTGVLLQAQPSRPLTLEVLLEQAFQQNRNIQNARLGTLLPDEQRAEVRANLLPQINANGNYQYFLEVPRQMVPASAFGGPEGQYTAAQFGVPLNLNTSLQATQVLYSQPLRVALKQVETGREVAQLQLRGTREDVAFNVSAAFYNAQALAKQIAFLESNLASLGKVTQTAQLLVDQQLAIPMDVQRLQLEQENLQNHLQNLRDRYDRTLHLLQLLAGIPQAETIHIDTAIVVPEMALLAQPEIQRTDLQLIEKQKGLNLLDQQGIRAGALPTVAAFGSYSYTGFGKFGDNNLLRFYPSSAVGLTMQWNIFDGLGRRAKLSQKTLEFQQLGHQQAYLQENIDMEITNARNQILSNRRSLVAAESSVQLAGNVLQQTALQLREGLANITDLLNAENALREAQINYLSTLINLRTAQLEMDKATGHLLDR
ncbi:MAG TPA: TolC family protein [Saprospiraceae bacterium]|nr:TolC family protein [Saprospiraceae bacterium]